MTRRAAALLAAALALAACGTVSASSAMRSWVTQSAFHSTVATLRTDAGHAATALRDARSTPNELHTVCAVLSLDAQQANSALPSPDSQSTTLLGRAYAQIGRGAERCYGAAADSRSRATAITDLQTAIATLAEGDARVAAAS